MIIEEKITQGQLIKIARRLHNSRRSYLLVNLFQAKHVPTKPSIALQLMRILGQKLKKIYGIGGIVIGFAETATAIGAVCAAELNAYYLPTTREEVPHITDWLDFSEEHSHAQQQRLALNQLRKITAQQEKIIFIDDELSTGKTIRNLIKAFKKYGLDKKHHQYVAACFVERLNNEQRNLLQQENVEIVALLHEKKGDYEQRAKSIPITAPVLPNQVVVKNEKYIKNIPQFNPRQGIEGLKYFNAWEKYALKLVDFFQKQYSMPKTALVLGTEECMLPGLLIASALEKAGVDVYSQATTRSPIGISHENDYPIYSGWQICSFYDDTRINYIYDLQKYDAVFIVSDAKNISSKSKNLLLGALGAMGNDSFIWIGDEHNVGRKI